MDMQALGDWLYGTALSSAIRDYTWVVPMVQSIHILAITVVVGCALIIELRIVGTLAADEPFEVVLRRYLPRQSRALIVLLLSGAVLIVGEPDRTLTNPFFWTKMTLVAAAATLSLAQRQRAPGKPLAWVLLAIWVAAIVCGRFIAYSK